MKIERLAVFVALAVVNLSLGSGCERDPATPRNTTTTNWEVRHNTADTEVAQLQRELDEIDRRLREAQEQAPVFLTEEDPYAAALLFAMRRAALDMALTPRDQAAVDFAYLRLENRGAVEGFELRQLARDCYAHADALLAQSPQTRPQ